MQCSSIKDIFHDFVQSIYNSPLAAQRRDIDFVSCENITLVKIDTEGAEGEIMVSVFDWLLEVCGQAWRVRFYFASSDVRSFVLLSYRCAARRRTTQS